MKIIISESEKLNEDRTVYVPCISVQIDTKEHTLAPEKYAEIYAEIEKIKQIMLSVIL